MCILGVAVRAHPEYPLIIIDNRDEYYTRPTRDALVESKTGILCGRDLSAGGTWCGVHAKTGDLAILTNVFDPNGRPPQAHPLSRGKVVESFILGEHENTYKEEIIPEWGKYMGFNLIFGNLFRFSKQQKKINNGESNVHSPSLYYLSNRSKMTPPTFDEPKVHRISQGIHVVSNSYLDDWTWPKVKFLRDEMEKILSPGESHTPAEMKNLLSHLLTSRPMLSTKDVPDYIKEEIAKFCRSKQEEYKTSVTSLNSGITMHFDEFDEMIMESCCNIFVDYCKKFKTKSQTIMLVDKKGEIYYYYRNTDELSVPEPFLPQDYHKMEIVTEGWVEHKIAPPKHIKRKSVEFHK